MNKLKVLLFGLFVSTSSCSYFIRFYCCFGVCVCCAVHRLAIQNPLQIFHFFFQYFLLRKHTPTGCINVCMSQFLYICANSAAFRTFVFRSNRFAIIAKISERRGGEQSTPLEYNDYGRFFIGRMNYGCEFRV